MQWREKRQMHVRSLQRKRKISINVVETKLKTDELMQGGRTLYFALHQRKHVASFLPTGVKVFRRVQFFKNSPALCFLQFALKLRFSTDRILQNTNGRWPTAESK